MSTEGRAMPAYCRPGKDMCRGRLANPELLVWLPTYLPMFNTYTTKKQQELTSWGIIIGVSFTVITYCPWCGRELGEER